MSKRENLARFMMKSGILPISALVNSPDLTILGFHRVGTPSSMYTGDRSLFSINLKEFRRLLELCARRFDIAPLTAISESIKRDVQLPRPTLAITFDDGYLDNFTEVAPMLKELGIPATFFICPGLVDDPHSRWWDTLAAVDTDKHFLPHHGFDSAEAALKAIKSAPASVTQPLLAALREYSRACLPSHAEQIMTWEMVQGLHRQGFEVGAHSLTHRVLSSLSASEQQHEIFESKHRLELHLNTAVEAFAYPVGGAAHYQPETARLVEDAGFKSGVTYGISKKWRRGLPHAHLTLPRLAASGSANLIFGSILGLWKFDQ